MFFGAQLYTVRDFVKTEDQYEASLKKIREMGYEFIQISGVGDFPVRRMKEIADRYELKVIVTHTNPKRIVDDTQTVIDEHKLLGANYVGIGSMPDEYRKSKEGVLNFIRDFTPAANAIREAGLQFMYHNHDFEFEKFDGKLGIEYLIEGFSKEQLGFIVDVYWVQAAGADPAWWLRKLKDRVDVIHFKDYKILQGKPVMSEILEGNLNWDAIFDACEFAGVQYAFVEQDHCNGLDPFDCLALSLKNLQKRS